MAIEERSLALAMRVMIVDDNLPLAENLAELLGDEGHEAHFSGSPCATAECEDCFDAYVLDVMMPDMNGWQLQQVLRERCPGARFILVSGYADDELRPPKSEAPLAKPVRVDELLQRLTE